MHIAVKTQNHTSALIGRYTTLQILNDCQLLVYLIYYNEHWKKQIYEYFM